MLLVIIWTAISVSLVHSRGFSQKSRDEILKGSNQLPQLEPSETVVELQGLKGTLRSDTFSKWTNVTQLYITNPRLTVIENSAFCSAPNMKSLKINFRSDWRSPRLTKRMFANCDHLAMLIITVCCDDPFQVDNDILQNTPNLIFLFLRKVNLKSLEKETLKNLESLWSMTARDCGIQDIDPAAFHSLKNVLIVDVSHNKLTTIPRGLFKNTPQLTKLDLSYNKISGLTWDEFDGLTALKTLNLEGNKISSFNTERIARYLPNLEDFIFKRNPFDCTTTEIFGYEPRSPLDHRIRMLHDKFSSYCNSREHRKYLRKLLRSGN